MIVPRPLPSPADLTATDLAAEALTDEDIDTLRHLLRVGTRKNSLCALRSDLAYLEAWSIACDGRHLPWPPTRDLVLRFIAHHLWDPDRRASDPSHGMPGHVRQVLVRGGFLRTEGPHAPATVQRRLASWRSLAAVRGGGEALADPVVRRTLAAAIRASRRGRASKSPRIIDRVLMQRLVARLDPLCAQAPYRQRDLDRHRLTALRDRALLTIAWAAGGRRRSEVAGLMCGQLVPQPPVPDEAWPGGMPALGLRLGQTKTTDAEQGGLVWVCGSPVLHLDEWRTAAGIRSGPVFRPIDRWGRIGREPLTGQAVSLILKRRLAEIGEPPAEYSAHGLRTGYITDALRDGIPAADVMEQTLHRSLRAMQGYVRGAVGARSPAARLLG